MSKSIDAFRTISEVAETLDVPKHVLRFWELRFPQIKPMKRGGGRRYYRRADVELLLGIKELLHAQGYTIKGVQKILREKGVEAVKQVAEVGRSGAVLDPASMLAPAPAKRAKPAERAAARTRQMDALTRRQIEAVIGELKQVRELIQSVRNVSLQPVEPAAAAASQPEPRPRRRAKG